jgi:probable rRNA maturation factor
MGNASHAPLIDVGFDARKPWVPSVAALRRWVLTAVPTSMRHWALSLRIVGAARSRTLNTRYRHQQHPTNVLSFAGAGIDAGGRHWLGELVICAPVLEREAKAQQKPREAHWAHIVVHGVLHLLGHDHEHARPARQMAAKEVQILELMGFSDPYRSGR